MGSSKKNSTDLFEAYYSNLFLSHWVELKAALLMERNNYTCLQDGLSSCYYLDPASYEAALSLTINEGDYILDMCSAPGGKALVLASRLKENCKLLCNEISAARRERLIKVINTIQNPILLSRIEITPYDATKFGLHRPSSFDKILLDAPCSSEAHILASKKHYQIWSPNRIKVCAQKQFALLASAFDALKPGGKIIYSTCALLPDENDDVVFKLTKKRDGVELEDFSSQFGKKADNSLGTYTNFGIQILPTRENLVGPIYYAKIKKALS